MLHHVFLKRIFTLHSFALFFCSHWNRCASTLKRCDFFQTHSQIIIFSLQTSSLRKSIQSQDLFHHHHVHFSLHYLVSVTFFLPSSSLSSSTSCCLLLALFQQLHPLLLLPPPNPNLPLPIICAHLIVSIVDSTAVLLKVWGAERDMTSEPQHMVRNKLPTSLKVYFLIGTIKTSWSVTSGN